MSKLTENRLRDLLLRCMLADMEALKPGNVGYQSPGHGMDADMFVKSAEIAAPIIATGHYSAGERILKAVQGTAGAVGCNTNLGIIMLCSPLAMAMQASGSNRSGAGMLRATLSRVLGNMDASDGGMLYQAIRIASPGGLGNSARYDVLGSDGGNIQAAMHYARHRDRIALQYCSVFNDIFTMGWPSLARFRRMWGDVAWALSACYITLLCSFADSHIQRSHGDSAAGMVQGEARTLWHNLSSAGPPAGSGLSLWHGLDNRCKQQGLNPGTSADLSVASLFVELWLSG